MAAKIEFKVCGLTRSADARGAQEAGASYLGFIFYAKSPRRIALQAYREIAPELPALPKVAVTVSPTEAELEELKRTDFDFFQIHFSPEKADASLIASWTRQVGKNRLWLAPKLSSPDQFDEQWLEVAETFLWDAHKKDEDAYGGTGLLSDWKGFHALSSAHPEKRWILAGGLSPKNAESACRLTGARVLDFNSCLERAPGIKDPRRLQEVGEAVSRIEL